MVVNKRIVDARQKGVRKRPPRKDVISRAFKIVKLFQTGRSFTVPEIADALDLTYKNAKGYIDAASLSMPIIEAWGTYPVEYKMEMGK